MKRFHYDPGNFRGDLAGGITAGIVALPLALAFGVQSGLGPIAGLYGAIALGIFAALFGGTRTQISGPTGPMTVVATLVVANSIERAGGLESAMGLILATFLLAGVFQIILGFLRAGSYVKYIPYPVVSGFMTGIAVITILLQVFPFMGQASPKKFTQIVMQIPEGIRHMNGQAFLLAAATVLLVYLVPKVLPRLNRYVPSSLVALIGVSLFAHFAGWEVPRIGEIPEGLPALHLGAMAAISLEDWHFVLFPALTLGLLGCIDSLLTSVIVDNISKTRHNSNQELIGQGIGNMMAASLGGLPGAGTTMTSVINATTGARTRMGGVVHGSFLFLILMGFGKYASHIPLAVLAGILTTIGFNIVDYKGLRHLTQIARSEAALMLVVLFLTVFVDLIEAVGVGMVLSSFLFMKHMGDMGKKKTHVSPLQDFALHQGNKPFGVPFEFPEALSEEVFVKHVNGPLFFGFAQEFQDMAKQLPKAKVIILDFDRVTYIDQSGLYALEEVVRDLKEKGTTVVLAHLHKETESMMRKVGLVPGLVSEKNIFPDVLACTRSLQAFAN